MALFTEQATALRVGLKLKKRPDFNPIVLIDKVRTQQILINLVQNALKFSQRGQAITIIIDKVGESKSKSSNQGDPELLNRFMIKVFD